MKSLNLYKISQDQRLICEAIDEAGGEITPELEAMLRITEERMVEKAEDFVEAIKEAEAIAQLADLRIKEAQAVKVRMKNRSQRLKETLKGAMEQFGIDRLALGVNSLGFRRSRAVEITDETKVPNRYVKVATTIDKAALLADLKAGEVVEGARLIENRNLTIR